MENLGMGAMLPRARGKATKMMDEVFALFPRLGERKKQLAGTLSGGEQQMLAIGRCLMGCPELIMFDEPSIGLAPALTKILRHSRAEPKGLPILLVDKTSARSSSRGNATCGNGRIVMSGAGSALLNDERVRRAYLGL